ncbi:MAG: hypothetical protein HGB37_00075 [Candidatus Moranbacteria bacterium]|nr:hypothetical protein [Candidatus Moranbacteria bacterium]
MRFETGNLDSENTEHPERSGWCVGGRAPEASLMRTGKCSVKWVTHPEGMKKRSGSDLESETRTTVILLSGRWLTRFAEDGSEVILESPGDYLTYEGALAHENEALSESRLSSSDGSVPTIDSTRMIRSWGI